MLPLSDITVVVTRPREQAGEFKTALEQFGARVVLFPTIEIAPPDSYDKLDAAIGNLSAYDWLILTSANAAEHFLKRLEAKNVETAELDYLRLCAIGEATAERLRLAQIHIDLLPTEARAEGVFKALTEYLGGELNGLRFLMPRSAIGREFLPDKLREAGAEVDDITAYQSVLPQNADTPKLKALLQGGAVDCATFTSPSTFNNFVQIFPAPELLKDVTIACIGTTTAEAVQKQGFTPHIISEAADSTSFARTIAKFFQSFVPET